MNNADEIISAALDGERVDVPALGRALATSEGRETLAAFVLLRAATADDDLVPAAALPVLTERRQQTVGRRARSLAGYRVPAALAASIVVIAVALSFWVGATWRSDVAGAGSQGAATVASNPAQANQAEAGSREARAGVSSPAQATPARAGSHETALTPCAPGSGAANGPAVRRVRVPVRDELPKPTRFLQFVPGVDWHVTTGPEH